MWPKPSIKRRFKRGPHAADGKRQKTDKGGISMNSDLFRMEEDSLGKGQVPFAAYYGVQTMRAKENFPITHQSLNNEFIIALAKVKKSAAKANGELLKLDRDLANAIMQASDEIIDGRFHDHIIVDPIQGGAGTSMNMNMNEIIANRGLELLGERKGNYSVLSPNTHVNMSQSTNDVVPSAANIAFIVLSQRFLEILEDVSNVLKSKAEEFDAVFKLGRTHLQDAVPIRLGQEFESYHKVVRRDIQRIQRSCESLYEVNIGATAIGTSLNADPEYIDKVTDYLVDETGLTLKSADHFIDLTQNTDRYTGLSSSLKICMTNVSKICNDLRLMASGPRGGLGELNLPTRQPGSSIMPGKVNPVMCEVVNQVAFQVIGNDQTIHLASEAGQLELNVMQPVILFNLFQSIEIMTHSFSVFNEYCLKGITPNRSQCRDHVENSVGIVTALIPYIGYEKAAYLAKKALKRKGKAKDICIEEDILTHDELERILNPCHMTGAQTNHQSQEIKL